MDARETLDWLNGILPAPLTVARGGDFRVGLLEAEGHAVACTTDFARVETGLAASDEQGVDVRCELMAVAGSASISDAALAAVRVVGTAAAVLAEGGLPAQPGTVLDGLAARAGLAGETTVRHGLLAPPTVWGGQVPQVNEAPGTVHGEGTDASRGRLTAVLQVVMVTDAEAELARAAGPERLLEALALTGADPGDWARPAGGPAAG